MRSSDEAACSQWSVPLTRSPVTSTFSTSALRRNSAVASVEGRTFLLSDGGDILKRFQAVRTFLGFMRLRIIRVFRTLKSMPGLSAVRIPTGFSQAFGSVRFGVSVAGRRFPAVSTIGPANPSTLRPAFPVERQILQPAQLPCRTM